MVHALDSLRDAEVHLYIASLGFGLVRSTQTISSYNLNMQLPAESPSSLLNIVNAEPFEPIRWWGTINGVLYKEETPIARMIANKEYDLIVVALTNNFLLLVSADIASASQMEGFQNVRVLGPKGVNWLQKYMRHIAKRGVIMPYTPRMNDLIPGSRNDFAQRCAMHFFREILIPNDFKGTSAEDRERVAEKLGGKANGGATQSFDQAMLNQLIEKYKTEDLTMSSAYMKAHSEAQFPITFEKFQRAWGMQDQTETTGDEMDDALAAIQAVGLSNVYDDQTEVMSAIRLFITALNKQGGGVFQVKDLASWAKIYYDRRNKQIPDTLQSPTKLGKILSTMSEELRVIKSMSALGGRQYEVRP